MFSCFYYLSELRLIFKYSLHMYSYLNSEHIMGLAFIYLGFLIPASIKEHISWDEAVRRCNTSSDEPLYLPGFSDDQFQEAGEYMNKHKITSMWINLKHTFVFVWNNGTIYSGYHYYYYYYYYQFSIYYSCCKYWVHKLSKLTQLTTLKVEVFLPLCVGVWVSVSMIY